MRGRTRGASKGSYAQPRGRADAPAGAAYYEQPTVVDWGIAALSFGTGFPLDSGGSHGEREAQAGGVWRGARMEKVRDRVVVGHLTRKGRRGERRTCPLAELNSKSRSVLSMAQQFHLSVLTRLSIGTQFWVFTYALVVCFVLVCI